MIYFKKYDRGLIYGACDDDDAPAIVGMLKDGYAAKRYSDEQIAEELISLDVDELEVYHVLALSCVGVLLAVGEIASQTAVEGHMDEFEVGEQFMDDVNRKAYFALLDWGDGLKGEALLINHARDDVQIEYREGWKR